MSNRTNFLILFQGRTGSSYLIDILKQHPDVIARGEIIEKYRFSNADKPGTLKHFGKTARMIIEGSPAHRQSDAIRKLYGNSNSNKKAIGFKTKVSDIEDFYAMRDVLRDFDVKIILMDRSNLVKHAISLINALRLHQKTKHKYGKLGWNLYDEKERLDPQSISYEEFDAALKRTILDRKILLAYVEYIGLPHLDLEYADLLKSKEEWVKCVFDFLGIQDQNIKSRILKNTNDDLTKAISNFDELKSHYVGTEFQNMFDETI